ncbi:MAG: glycosyltransferase, partial [Gammaproteobacteria bacterium]|nr:glycosyltransferase [Gammaproteobacteria bacterium]
VSIIIPSFNQGKYIRETIQSCLDQDYRPIEIIVQDGGSKDETLDIVRSFNCPELTLVVEKDNGVVDAVNKALLRSHGDILTIQSSDDVFLPSAISAAVATLENNPAYGIVYGDVKHIDSNSTITGEDVQGEFDLLHYLGRFSYIPQPGTFFTRNALNSVKGWRADYSYAADADFWMRIALQYPVYKLHQFVGAYRYHPEQRDTQKEKIANDWCGLATDLIRTGKLSFRQRRYARMGMHLANYRYTSEENWVYRTVELYSALLSNPIAIFNSQFPKRELFPGRAPLWSLLSRIKQAIGLKPRTM